MGDIASQEDAVRTLKAAVASGSLPHLLFYGPPGTGKTSTILALARELYGCVRERGKGEKRCTREGSRTRACPAAGGSAVPSRALPLTASGPS